MYQFIVLFLPHSWSCAIGIFRVFFWKGCLHEQRLHLFVGMNGIDAKYRTSHGSHVFLFNFSVADSSSLGVGILLQETPKFRVGLIVFTEARDGLLSVSLRQKMTYETA